MDSLFLLFKRERIYQSISLEIFNAIFQKQKSLLDGSFETTSLESHG